MMRKGLFILISFFLIPGSAFARGKKCTLLLSKVERSFGLTLADQSDTFLTRMLQNISPEGHRGAVVASTSKDKPNYYFHWVRDAGLTMMEVAKLFSQTKDRALRDSLGKLLKDYVDFSAGNQNSKNRSGPGDFQSQFKGLGEPKFNLDGTPYDGDWGRPQSDGPAFRALALMDFAESLLAGGEKNYVLSRLYDGKFPRDTTTVIKKDLEYIMHNWEATSFDVWEEVSGHHFFTFMVQRRALLEGARFARQLGDTGAAQAYEDMAKKINGALDAFWDKDKKIIIPTKDVQSGLQNKTSGLDSAVILGVLYGSSDNIFNVSDDRVLSTAFNLEAAFKKLYPINNKGSNGTEPSATLIGRYPEDIYDGDQDKGGNPWVLITYSFGELYYRVSDEISKRGSIQITDNNIEFFKNIVSDPARKNDLIVGKTFGSQDPIFKLLVSGLSQKADSFIKRTNQWAGPNGELSEQLDRTTGSQVSAHDLTWNYVAVLRAAKARSYLTK